MSDLFPRNGRKGRDSGNKEVQLVINMYTDLITQIKNGQQARKETIRFPFSKMDFAVAQTLSDHGFIGPVEKKGRMPKRSMDITLKYREDGSGVMTGSRFVSKPSRKVYASYKTFYSVRQGFGLGIVSTSQGIMSTKDAKIAKIGGQLLFEVW